MLIVLGSASAAPGKRDELVAAARDVTAAARADDGCVSYGFAADLDDVLLERYAQARPAGNIDVAEQRMATSLAGRSATTS